MGMVVGKKLIYRKIMAHAVLIAILMVMLFPVLMVFSISFRTGNLALGSLIPENPSLEHWKVALGISYTDANGNVVHPPFPVLTWLYNSVKISAISSALVVLLSVTCAYAFARLKFHYKQTILGSLLLLQMFPAVLALVAIYAILSFIGSYIPWLGLDTHGGLILAYLGMISMNIWMIKGYFENIPASMEESAMMDGATPFQTLIYILLPMSYPILAVVFIISFITNFNEFPVASIILQQEENLTMAVGLRFFLQEQNFLWGDFAASAILGGLPITIIFLMFQRFLVSGLTAGAAKE